MWRHLLPQHCHRGQCGWTEGGQPEGSDQRRTGKRRVGRIVKVAGLKINLPSELAGIASTMPMARRRKKRRAAERSF